MQCLVTTIHTLRLSVELANVTKSTFNRIEIHFVGLLLIIDDRLFDTLCQVDTVNRIDTFQVSPVHHIYKAETLLMNQFAEIE